MRFYETIFIVKPDLTDEVLAEREAWAKDILTNNGADIVNVERWGKKRLAYQIEKQRYGHYYLVHYEGPPSVVPEMERNFRMSEDIMKYITVKLEGKQVEQARQAAVKAAEDAARQAEARAEEAAKAEEPTDKEASEQDEEESPEDDED